MRTFLSLVLLTSGCYGISFPRLEGQLARVRRSISCGLEELDSRASGFESCIDRTTDDFGRAVDNYDGRSHFLERKTCNAMEGMMNCLVQILPCFSDDMKEEHMASQMKNIDGIIAMSDDFDVNKCPYYAWFEGGYKTQPNGLSSASITISPFSIGILVGFISIKFM